MDGVPHMINDPSSQVFEQGQSRNRRQMNTMNDHDFDHGNYVSQRGVSLPGLSGNRTLLSQNGSNIMGGQVKKVAIKSNFLRKGFGSGGSPTQFEQAIIDPETGKAVVMSSSQYSNDSPRKKASMIPVRRDNLTTVRVRTKNNSFVYGEQSMEESMNQSSRMLDPHEINMMWQKKK
jgi:hypothetical protein